MPRIAPAVAVAAAAAALACAAAAAPPRAEIQVALCGDPDAIARALDLRPREPAYETWLFDDAALSLLNAGVRIRLRAKRDDAELTVKAADQDCAALAPGLVPKKSGKCEYDVHGDLTVGAVSLSTTLAPAAAQDLIAGKRSVGSALAAHQVRFLQSATHAWPLSPALRPLGPVANSVYATTGDRYDVDVSRLPTGERYVEISTKVPVAKVPAARGALLQRLAQAGVEPCADQAGQVANKLRALLR